MKRLPEEEEKEGEGEKKRKQEPLIQLLFLKGGTYNCAHKVKINANESYIIRVALVFDDVGGRAKRKILLRGLRILSILHEKEYNFGPSLVEEKKDFDIDLRLRTLQKTIDVTTLCPSMLNIINDYSPNSYTFMLQYLEYLSGGEVDYVNTHNKNFTLAEYEFCLFSLLWFFVSLQEIFGFKHRDLKNANMVFREYGTGTTHTFKDGDVIYNFTSRYAPVVIDFDFATVATTITNDSRYSVGTYYTAPPELLMEEILTMFNVPVGPQNVYFPNDGSYIDFPNYARMEFARNEYAWSSYDYWSIGISMLCTIWLNLLDPTFDNLKEIYAQSVFKDLVARYRFRPDPRDLPAIQSILSNIAVGIVIARVFTRGPNDRDEFLKSTVYDPIFFTGRSIKILNAMLEHQDAKKLLYIRNSLNGEWGEIMTLLLSWNPYRRTLNGNPRRYFQMGIFKKYSPSQLKTYEYDFNGLDDDAISLAKYPELEHKI